MRQKNSMKMRIRGNSIRLRLTQTEVAEFDEKDSVEEVVEFGDEKKLIYALRSKSGAENVSAEFSDNRVVIIIPQDQANNWVKSNEVGIQAEQNIGDGRVLRLLIEKDFACLQPRRGEDDADTFPHPSGNAKC